MGATTRSRIIDTIRVKQAVSAIELSRILGMTGANIRHHLAVLKANRLVEVIGRQYEGRGRPVDIYGISSIFLGNGMEQLACALLDECPENDQDKYLGSIGRRMGEGFHHDPEPFVSRLLTEFCGFLNRMNYQARWEAGATGAQLILGRCPFRAILDEHPEICKIDMIMIETCLDSKVVQEKRLERTRNGLTQCVFMVQ